MGGILIAGGSGYLGGLIATALLVEEGRRLLLPLRAKVNPADCLTRLQIALLDYGVPPDDVEERLRLITFVDLPEPGRLQGLDSAAAAMGIDEIVHCAGCVDYFDKQRLRLANIELTAELLEAARRWKTRRFIYLSTAYCAGYRSEEIPEQLHPDPAPQNEPTEYTRTKRAAEWRIAESGVPFIIIRPSIVIGDSRTGVYRGNNYGLYQTWRAWEGLLGTHYSSVWFTVAPPVPLNLVHQDAFQSGFMAIYRATAPGEIIHLISDRSKSPTLREICWLWADVYCPTEIRCYPRVDDVPLASLPNRQRRFLELVAKNLEIATHQWNFASGNLDRLRQVGLRFPDATIKTLALCQRRYVEGSAKLQEHLRQNAGRSRDPPRFLEFVAHPSEGSALRTPPSEPIEGTRLRKS